MSTASIRLVPKSEVAAAPCRHMAHFGPSTL